MAERIRRHLRPLYVALDFAGTDPDSPWLVALAWAKGVFAKQQRLSQRPLAECPGATLPKRLRPYLLTFDADGKPTGLHADRYEFWLYRQVRKRLQSGELYLDDSLQHRHFSDELVSMDEKAAVLAQMIIPFLRQPVDAQLDALTAEPVRCDLSVTWPTPYLPGSVSGLARLQDFLECCSRHKFDRLPGLDLHLCTCLWIDAHACFPGGNF